MARRSQKSVPVDAIDAAKREIGLANLAFYCSEYLTGEQKPPYNGRFIISEHHQDWSDFVNKHKRNCVLAPRDSGKSYFWSKGFPIWTAEKNPWVKGPQPEQILFGASQPKARKTMIKIKREIERNPRLAHLDPGRSGQRRSSIRWSADCLEFANGHVLYGYGFDTRARGDHVVALTVDDCLTEEDAYSETVREYHKDYFLAAIEPMVVPGGQLNVVGTPFSDEDLYGRLREIAQETGEYHYAQYSAVIGADDPSTPGARALWPERYPLDVLIKQYKKLGPLLFSREYLCKPMSDVASLFPKYLFEQDGMRVPYNLGQGDWRFWRRAGIERVVMGIDIAATNEAGADFFVIFIVGLDKHGNRWILDIIRHAGLPFHRQLEAIKTAHQQYRADIIFIESNQMQRVWKDELVRTTDLPVRAFHTGAEKHTLDKGLPFVRTILENAKYRIPVGNDERTRETIETWVNEMRSHSLKDGKLFTAAKHDDTVMAMYIAEEAIKASNFGFATEASDEDSRIYEEEMRAMLEPDVEEVDDEEEYAPEVGDDDAENLVIRLFAAVEGTNGFRPKAKLIDLTPEPGTGTWAAKKRAERTERSQGRGRNGRRPKPPPERFTSRELFAQLGLAPGSGGEGTKKGVTSLVEMVLGHSPGKSGGGS